MAAFGVFELADRSFGTLSEGERKRVQIARALMSDPEVLLLDEPSAGLDLGGREELVSALSEMAGDRRAPVMLLVTHHLEEIPPGFTHAALMAGGRLTAAGELATTLTDANLTDAFGMPLRVIPNGPRWTAVSTR
jgi:iron complex transport system ATP-binding protein